jgi:predicted flap endonuclease-1-like 5' DNA nuclease
MNGTSLFILGLLIGWLVEWIIDWLYWRRKHKACQEEKARLEARIEELEKEREAPPAYSIPAEQPQAVADDLTLINGVGPVIAGMLKDADIDTFEKLAALPIEKLRDILGDLVERLVDEQSLLDQARELAKEKRLASRALAPKKKSKGKKGKKAGKKEKAGAPDEAKG